MRIAYRRRYEKRAARRIPSIKPAIEQDVTWHARTTGLELGVPKVERRLAVCCWHAPSHQQPHQYWVSSLSWANSAIKPGARE